MRKSTVIKAAAAALALIVTSGSIGFAAGRATNWYFGSVGTPNTSFEKYEDTAKANFDNEVIKCLSNGFAFKESSYRDYSSQDDDGHTVSSGTALDAYYEKDGTSIIFGIRPDVSDDIITGATLAGEQDDIKYYYKALKNKFVPTDYEPTEEEQALVDSGELNISYGSNEIEEKTSQSLHWQKDGKTYSLFGFDTRLGAEDLLQMALEIQ